MSTKPAVIAFTAALSLAVTLIYGSFMGYGCKLSENVPADQAFIDLEYTQTETPKGILHQVIIPALQSKRLKASAVDHLQTLEGFVKANSPEIAINGGFFDPTNGKTTSFVSINGQQWLDPTENERLTHNMKLKPYLERIFDRKEFRQYQCQNGVSHDIVPHSAPIPESCKLAFALGAGPALYPEFTARQGAFIDYDAKGRMIRDPIGIHRPNARSAIGIRKNGDIIVLMAARKNPKRVEAASSGPGNGFSLSDISEHMQQAGAVKVLALDGGGSSGLYYHNRYFYGKYSRAGEPEKRRIKSVLMVMPAAADTTPQP